MKVICIKAELVFEIGMSYKYTRIPFINGIYFYKIFTSPDDDAYIYTESRFIECFTTLQEYRNQKINKILE